MHEEPAEYYRARERSERAAAENAASPEARRAHQEMALAYARLADARTPQSEPRAIPLG